MVTLRALDDPTPARLLATAVADADPSEVMALVPGAPGWTPERLQAFVDYHRRCRPAPERVPPAEATYAVVSAHGSQTGDDVVGALRLVRCAPDSLEVGLWLGRPYRGCGIGRVALAAAADVARDLGARRLVAPTSRANAAAVRALVAGGYEIGPPGPAGELTAGRDLA